MKPLPGSDRLRGTTEFSIARNIVHQAYPPLPPDLPLELREAVAKALDKNPDERYQSMCGLVVDLKRILQASPAETSKQGSRVRRRWTVPALAAVVIAASTAVYVLRQSDFFGRNPLDRARIEQVTDFEGDELDADLSRNGKWMTFLSDRGGRFNAWVARSFPVIL